MLSTALKSPNSFVRESTSIAFNIRSDFFNYNLIANVPPRKIICKLESEFKRWASL